MAKEKKDPKKKTEPKFTKEQFLKAKKYANYIDVINAIIGKKELSEAELDDNIKKFMKGKVK